MTNYTFSDKIQKKIFERKLLAEKCKPFEVFLFLENYHEGKKKTLLKSLGKIIEKFI